MIEDRFKAHRKIYETIERGFPGSSLSPGGDSRFFKIWVLVESDTTFLCDTTATTLTHIFYELSCNPEHISKLRKEIARHISPSEDIHDQNLKYVHHLNGATHKTLRLYVPSCIYYTPASNAIQRSRNRLYAVTSYRLRFPNYSVLTKQTVERLESSTSVETGLVGQYRDVTLMLTLSNKHSYQVPELITSKETLHFLGFTPFDIDQIGITPLRGIYNSVEREFIRGILFK